MLFIPTALQDYNQLTIPIIVSERWPLRRKNATCFITLLFNKLLECQKKPAVSYISTGKGWHAKLILTRSFRDVKILNLVSGPVKNQNICIPIATWLDSFVKISGYLCFRIHFSGLPDTQTDQPSC